MSRGGAGARLVAAGWVGVLVTAVGVGLFGDEPAAPASPGLDIAASPVVTSTAEPPATRLPAASRPSRPPIGEDGIMGGLPFGTAWRWLEPERRGD